MDSREQPQPKIRAMSKTELANAYQVSLKTFAKWITPFKEKIGDYLGRAYTPKQIHKIFELLGKP
jgi:transposase